MGFIGHAPLICIAAFVYLTVKITEIVLVIQKNQYSACCVCRLLTFKPAAELLRNLKPRHINFFILPTSLLVSSTAHLLISSAAAGAAGGCGDPGSCGAGAGGTSGGMGPVPCPYPNLPGEPAPRCAFRDR